MRGGVRLRGGRRRGGGEPEGREGVGFWIHHYTAAPPSPPAPPHTFTFSILNDACDGGGG